MEVEIGKWGNSLALRIPEKMAREAGFTEGTSAELAMKDGALMITHRKKHPRRLRLEELLTRLEEIDLGAAVGREVVEWHELGAAERKRVDAALAKIHQATARATKSSTETDDFLAWRKTQWDE